MPASSKTFLAFIRIGIDAVLAGKLVAQNITLSKTQQMSDVELQGHGFSTEHIRLIRQKDRPPIPCKTVDKLLYESAFSCSVCSKPDIIIHHLVEWEISRSHSESNLVVLCLQHHGEAHTTREQSQNLTKGKLEMFKSRHIQKIRSNRANAAINIDPTRLFGSSAFWDYFNNTRLLQAATEIMREAKMPETLMREYRTLSLNGILSKTKGFQLPPEYHKKPYIYRDKTPFEAPLYSFFSKLLLHILSESPWIDLSDSCFALSGTFRSGSPSRLGAADA